ncbi:hypothetical protein F4779DRAFT_342436 [Xylariaceae sp. FL0662B]|nr:hypothetical protein F4779DRAFT_342436 [Xylariaceae sp. FL0662B]
MKFHDLLALTVLSLLAPTAPAQSGCASDCESCGWFCNNGCDAALSSPDCARCLYCRRESSSCGFVDIGDTWTDDPPSDELCDACGAGCWCHGAWYCMDDGGSPTPYPPTPTLTSTSTSTPTASVM